MSAVGDEETVAFAALYNRQHWNVELQRKVS